MERIAAAPPLLKARIAGVLYLLTILAGISSLVFTGRLGFVVSLIGGAIYMAVTLLLYDMFKPVNRSLSLIAALFSVAGFITSVFNWRPGSVDVSIVCFGFYCLLIGYLIFRSTFLPRIVGALMAFAGLSYLTFLLPALGDHLYPYNLVPGLIGEGSLTLWLIVFGLNVQRWKVLASGGRTPKNLIKPELGTA